MIPCVSVEEKNLLADAARIVEKNGKIYKRKDDLIKIVAEGLSSLGYDSSICKSKWEKTCSSPAGNINFPNPQIRFEIDSFFDSVTHSLVFV